MQKYCLFYLYSENIQETCGPRGYVPTDVPRLFIVRYKRNSTENELMAKRKAKAKNIWNTYQEENINVASQLVARYNGSEDVHEVCSVIYCNNVGCFSFLVSYIQNEFSRWEQTSFLCHITMTLSVNSTVTFIHLEQM